MKINMKNDAQVLVCSKLLYSDFFNMWKSAKKFDTSKCCQDSESIKWHFTEIFQINYWYFYDILLMWYHICLVCKHREAKLVDEWILYLMYQTTLTYLQILSKPPVISWVSQNFILYTPQEQRNYFFWICKSLLSL